MKNELRGLFRNARETRKLTLSLRLYVFLVCLAISVFLWILVRLSKEHLYTVEYRLNFSGYPSSLRMTGASDSVLILKLKAQGYDLFMERVLTGGDKTYDVSLQQLKLKHSDDRYTGFLLTPSLGYEIISQTGYPHSYLSTSPDTLFFEFQRKGSGRNR